MEQTQAHLNKAFHLHKSLENNLGTYYKIKSYVAFLQSKNGEGLHFSELSLEEYKVAENKPGIASALSDIAFFEILHGNYDHGRELSIQSQEMLEGLNLITEDREHYTRINFLLLAKCSKNMEYLEMITETHAYIKKSGDKNLEYLLNFAVEWDCVTQKSQRRPNE